MKSPSILQYDNPPSVAVICEETCIGCTKCLKACPVDAIIGTNKQMHTVIASECIGCERCLAPCPMDCIQMQQLPERNEQEFQAKLAIAKFRYEARNNRINRLKQEQQIKYREAKCQENNRQLTLEARRAVIQETVARVRANKMKNQSKLKSS